MLAVIGNCYKANDAWLQPEYAILIGALFATIGWLYSARRARMLSKKQHTMTLMITSNFNDGFLNDRKRISPNLLKTVQMPEIFSSKEEIEIQTSLRRVLNHYEFVSAGIRNGDVDEELFKLSERGTIIMVFSNMEDYILKLRNKRGRKLIYEHIEWLYYRWNNQKIGLSQKIVEKIRARPNFKINEKWYSK